MKTTILFLALLISSTFSQWNSIYAPTPEGDLAFSIAKGNANFIDNQGNCYITGYVNTFLWSYKDIVTIKYNPNGDTAWVRTYNGSENNDDEGTAITVDASGNVYVTGYAQLTGKYKDVILMKYNSSGNLLWAKTYGITTTEQEDRALGIAIDASGNIYVTGYGTGTDGLCDIITLKYDTNGNILWSKKEDGSYNNDGKGYGIVVDNSGNVLVTGYVLTQNNWEDIVVIKYTSAGKQSWSRTYNGSNNDEDKAWGIVVDADNNIYITGHTTIDWYSQNFDAVTLKYNSSGSLIWSKTYGGAGNAEDKAWGIVVDTDASIYITGNTTDANLNSNYLTVKYNSAGAQQWVAEYNGTGNGDDRANAIGIVNVNGVKSVVVTGASWGTDNNHDYATVRYSVTNGTQTSVNRYSLASFTEDVATDIAVNGSTVIVTGYSEIIFDNNSNGSSIVTQNIKMSSESVLNSDINLPNNFSLSQNYPNPFNPTTSINFNLPKDSKVKMVIYDLLGKEVDVLINQNLSAGSHSITFNASKLSSGIYFYELTAGDGLRDIKKMNLIK